MTYMSELGIIDEILNFLDYAISNDVSKDNVLFVVDALLEHYEKLPNGPLEIRLIHIDNIIDNIIDDSGLSSDELASKCYCCDLTLHDVLGEFSLLSPVGLEDLRLDIELI